MFQGCIDVDIQDEIDYDTNIMFYNIVALYWINDDEYAVSFSLKKNTEWTTDDIIKKINNLIETK